MADARADHAALRWLARQIAWEQLLVRLRGAHAEGTPLTDRERPAA